MSFIELDKCDYCLTDINIILNSEEASFEDLDLINKNYPKIFTLTLKSHQKYKHYKNDTAVKINNIYKYLVKKSLQHLVCNDVLGLISEYLYKL